MKTTVWAVRSQVTRLRVSYRHRDKRDAMSAMRDMLRMSPCLKLEVYRTTQDLPRR